MDSKQIIKYALIGVGAYLIYKQFFGGDQPTVTGSGNPMPGTGAGTQPPVNTPPPTNTQVQTQTQLPVNQVTEAQLIQWATNEQAASMAPASVVYTFDEWNYYRDKGGQKVYDALSVPGFNSTNRGTTKFNPSAYWAAMRAAGMNGGQFGMSGFGAQGFLEQYRNYSWLL